MQSKVRVRLRVWVDEQEGGRTEEGARPRAILGGGVVVYSCVRCPSQGSSLP